jgi:hypothetical protein
MNNAWLKERNCGIRMTIRDVDSAGFDVERMARDFHDLGVNFFSFFRRRLRNNLPLQAARVADQPLAGRARSGDGTGLERSGFSALSRMENGKDQRHGDHAAGYGAVGKTRYAGDG